MGDVTIDSDMVLDLLSALPHCGKGVCLAPATCDSLIASSARPDIPPWPRRSCEEHRSIRHGEPTDYKYRGVVLTATRALIASGNTPWWCEDEAAWVGQRQGSAGGKVDP